MMVLITIRSIVKAPQIWDEKCVFNINVNGERFVHLAKSARQGDSNSINELLFLCYRFLVEREFSTGPDEAIDHDSVKVKAEIENYIIQYGGTVEQKNFGWANLNMPFYILKHYLHHKNVSNIIEFNEKFGEASNLKEKWDKEIGEKILIVNSLKDKLESYKSQFNFVGLNQGFEKIRSDKL